MWQQELTTILQQAGYAPQEIENVVSQFNTLSAPDRRTILDFFKTNKDAVIVSLKYNLEKLKRAVILGNVRLVKRYLKELEAIK